MGLLVKDVSELKIAMRLIKSDKDVNKSTKLKLSNDLEKAQSKIRSPLVGLRLSFTAKL